MFSCFLCNKYRIVSDAIGTGAYGKVYVVSLNGKHYALKKVDLPIDYNDMTRILRELQILNLLSDCPYSVHIIDAWISKNHICFVMDLYEFSLDRVISLNVFMSEDHICYIALQLFTSLASIHSRGIVHRDIKPANVLINSNECKTVLCDYNLSRIVNLQDVKSDLTQDVVSRYYRAPELLHFKQYSSKVDIWAAACTIAELLIKKPLFYSKNEKEQLHMIQKNDFSILPECKTKEFLKYVLIYDDMLRPSAQEILKHPYFSVFNKPEISYGVHTFVNEVFGGISDLRILLYEEILKLNKAKKYL